MAGHTYKVIDLVGSSSESIEDAVQGAISRANETIQNLEWFQVKEVRGQIADGRVAWYQVSMGVGFRVDDPKDMSKGG
jgi:flavin-binding protein dodecin